MMKISRVVLGLSVLACSVPLYAAIMTFNTDQVVATDAAGVLNLSVYDGEAGWSGNGLEGMFGDGTVLDYAFYNDGTGTLATYAVGSSDRVGDASFSNISGSGTIDWANVWSVTESSSFTTLPDFEGASETFARVQGGGGTIDVSGMTSGIIYLIYGTFVDECQVSATLSGSGQGDIMIEATAVSAASTAGWITSFDFTTDEGAYTELSYSYTNDDTDASRARFMGVVVTGEVVPEPATMGMLGFGALVMFWMRRRRK